MTDLKKKAEEWARYNKIPLSCFAALCGDPERVELWVARTLEEAYLAGAKERDRWISVKDRLPDESGHYLVIRYEGDHGSDVSYSAVGKGWNICGNDRKSELFPLYWMELPEPPMKEALEES